MSDSMTLEFRGMDRLMKRLHALPGDAGRGLEIGLRSAGLILQREAQILVPVDTGNLHNSAFTRQVGKGLDTEVRVGFTAEYAIYVHEDLGAAHEPGKVAKFLESPLREKKGLLMSVIEQAAAREMRK